MTNAPVLLHDFQILKPPHEADQERILAWIGAAHTRAEATLHPAATAAEREETGQRMAKLVRRFGCGADRIRTRNTFLDDFTHTDWGGMRIFRLDRHPHGLPGGERARFFRETAEAAFERLFPERDDPPAVLIHVTCTGYVSPSAAQLLVARRGWGQATEVLHAYHMGCYAALPAIRMAAGCLAAGSPARGPSRVDLVHTELCSLHLDPARHDPEQLVVQTLFADGVIRYSASREAHGPGLELLAAREEIVPGTEDAMTWIASEFGMAMTLSRRVPEHIRDGLGPFLDRLAREAGLPVQALREQARFAIHPGGPRIIDEIQELLGLRPDQVAASNAVLRDRGNMSSATLPHVW
jgi:predicted naringenin-chalcone synthase